jgi:hypothetical protein
MTVDFCDCNKALLQSFVVLSSLHCDICTSLQFSDAVLVILGIIALNLSCLSFASILFDLVLRIYIYFCLLVCLSDQA